MEQAYSAIGRAVFAAQLFETVLIPIFEFFKMQTEPGYIEKTGGYIPVGAFKVPIKNVVKALSSKGSIASDLEERLNLFVEERTSLFIDGFRRTGGQQRTMQQASLRSSRLQIELSEKQRNSRISLLVI
jgi:hypothetical protein